MAAERAHKPVRRIIEAKDPLATSNLVFSELFTLLMARGHESIALDFGDHLRTGDFCNVSRVSDEDEMEAWRLLHEHRGRRLSHVDATIVTIMRRFHIRTIVTLDNAFREFDLDVLPEA
ncbi:MAG: PIN domain-containing protein [Deltaproteobacteria bacterium]|nr:PIN domain-containing protein [Deltaproteobacteria bacterium]